MIKGLDPERDTGQPVGAFGDDFDTTVPSAARMYDYFLGGKDNFPVDREAAKRAMALVPEIPEMAKANRWFLEQAVRYMAAECGIQQFLDVGSGLPTQRNVHEVAQAVAPDARVVYVDKDPIVLTHGRALLAGDQTNIVRADMRKPQEILSHGGVHELIDFRRPVGLLLIAALHFAPDDEAYRIVEALLEPMAPGSCLAISHVKRTDATEHAAEVWKQEARIPGVPRSEAEITRFFDGLELIGPGVVPVNQWRPDAPPEQQIEMPHLGGVARLGVGF
ncbi:SAM-dependent methyltransferase [Actinoallomurus acanthiterrae]